MSKERQRAKNRWQESGKSKHSNCNQAEKLDKQKSDRASRGAEKRPGRVDGNQGVCCFLCVSVWGVSEGPPQQGPGSQETPVPADKEPS